MLEMSAIESEGQVRELLLRQCQTFFATFSVPLALLGGIIPINRILAVLREVGPLEKVERLGGARVIGFWPPPEQGLWDRSGPESLIELAHIQEVMRKRRDGLAAMLDDVGQLLLSTKLAVVNVEEIGAAMDLAERVPGPSASSRGCARRL